MSGPTFLKLGGALLTDKRGRQALRADVLARLAAEIAAWEGARRGELVLAHGSGSFAHLAVAETGFLDHPADALAFARVASSARALSSEVVAALLAAGLPAVMVPGGLIARCRDGVVAEVRAQVVADLLAGGRLPVVYGDVAADPVRGGAIASTEPLLAGLADILHPSRILLATDVPGVLPAATWAELAGRQADVDHVAPVPRISHANLDAVLAALQPTARVVDVTGGMASKVGLMVELVERHPHTAVTIFSGLVPGAVRAALAGAAVTGTQIVAGAPADARR